MPQVRKVAVVTGGAKRVGRAIVERLAEDGFDGIFTYHSSAAGAEVLREVLTGRGARFLAVQADLSQPEESVDRIESALRGTFDRLDVLVHNASLYEQSSLAQTNIQQCRRLWAVHVEAPLLLSQRFAPLLRSSHGRIITMLDLLAERPWPQYLTYCASKAGLWNLTLGLARELAPEVTVNGIAPGVVDWPADYPEVEREKYLKRVPLRRAGTPQDVAELVHFLCSGGSYLTGQVIRLDGGKSIT